jgi:hypothetical protein
MVDNYQPDLKGADLMTKYVSAVLFAISTLLASAASRADTIDFEDVTQFATSGGVSYHTLVNDYGVHWGEGRYDSPGWHVGTTGPSWWYPGTPGNYAHSGDNYVFGPLISSLNIRGNGVGLGSMWARVANTTGPKAYISVLAIKNGSVVESKDFTLTDTYQLLTVNFFGADQIVVSGGSYGYLLLDDMGLSYAAPVPEPAAYGMLLAGVGLLGFMARRRRQ